MANDNKSLGRFILDGIPPAPRGVPQVEVTFDVDSNGVLSVTAKDKSTGKEQTIRIEANSGLSKDDIERMKADAEAHAAEDAKKKEIIETRNVADQMIYTAEKALKDHADKITDEVKNNVNDRIAAVRTVKDGEDKAAIETATQALSDAMSKIGEAMQQAAPASGDAAQAGPQEGEVVRDAEVTDEDKKN